MGSRQLTPVTLPFLSQSWERRLTSHVTNRTAKQSPAFEIPLKLFLQSWVTK